MAKTTRSTKSHARTPKSTRSSTRRNQQYSRSTLTLDQRLNFVGGVIVLTGVLTIVALFSRSNGPLTDWVATTTAQIAGWGGIIIPLILIISGAILLLRHYEKLPAIPYWRLAGAVLLYLNILVWFHFVVGGDFVTAKDGRGGGYIGAFFDRLLGSTLGGAGEAVFLFAWTLVAFLFILNIPLPELATRVNGLLAAARKPKPESEHQAPFSFTKPQSFKVRREAAKDVPVGYQPLHLEENVSEAEHDRTVALPQAIQPALLKEQGSVLPATQAAVPGVRTNRAQPSTPWIIPAVADILDPATPATIQSHHDRDRARIIEETLRSFDAPAHIVEIQRGPAVTQFGVEPDFIETRTGRTRVRVAKIVNLADDLALALSAASIRIQAPVPGKAYVGIEVPNSELSLVSLREVLESATFNKMQSKLRFAFGKDVAGKPICADLTAMPHLLIAGTTNSGKSVLVNAILTSMLLNNSPDDLRLVLVDPKRVELTGYNGIPHLLAPVVVDADRVGGALQWVLREMDSRYKRFSAAGVRNIVEYNKQNEDHLPYLVVVIDELADLMMLARDETERSITRLAQLARATGIHLIIATQRPSVDVITGVIKSNLPARVAFMVASGMDSRVIIDKPGAETLLGRGDMLYQAPDAPAPVRLQGVYVSDGEIQRLVTSWRVNAAKRKAEGGTELESASFESLPSSNYFKSPARFGDGPSGSDPMLDDAIEVVRKEGKASTSMLQRRLRIGYNRAAKLIDTLEEQKIIGPSHIGSQVREVLDYGDMEPEPDLEIEGEG